MPATLESDARGRSWPHRPRKREQSDETDDEGDDQHHGNGRIAQARTGDNETSGNIPASRAKRENILSRPVDRAYQIANADNDKQVEHVGADREAPSMLSNVLKFNPTEDDEQTIVTLDTLRTTTSRPPTHAALDDASARPIASGMTMTTRSGLAMAHGSALRPGIMSGSANGRNMMLPPINSTIRATE